MGADTAGDEQLAICLDPSQLYPAPILPSHRMLKGNIPGTGALAVGARSGVPDGLVRHDCGRFEVFGG